MAGREAKSGSLRSGINPDYSWMGVWRMSGVNHIRALTRQYSYRRFPFRSGVEIHLSGERRVYPDTRVEQALHASVCGNLNNQG